jgi:hypothetical protein
MYELAARHGANERVSVITGNFRRNCALKSKNGEIFFSPKISITYAPKNDAENI